MAEIFAFVLVVYFGLEAVFRVRMLWFSPWYQKLAYVFFLLGRKRLTENNVTNQRVIRGGFRSETDLFRHYSKIAGKPEAEIYEKFGRENTRVPRFSGYYSGGHGVFERAQRMHLGIVGLPNQKLRTLEIGEDGFRRTGWDKPPDQIEPTDRVCLLLGGSTAFGLGATSDRATIAGRIGHYLNLNSDVNFIVVNNAMTGFNSHQELLALLQSKYRPDYVVALSGYNELLQFADTYDKVALNAKQSERDLEISVGSALMVIIWNLLRRSVVLAEARRFMLAFCHHDEVRMKAEDLDPDVNIYPMR